MTPVCAFSPCRTWRYTLERYPFLPIYGSATAAKALWPEVEMTGVRLETLAFIGLNPSTADETQDDPTVRRCMGFAARWGYGRMMMLNLFGLRSTDPRMLYEHEDPVGPDNDGHLLAEVDKAAMVVIAWGNHGLYQERGDRVRDMLFEHVPAKVHSLAWNATGEPKHPLYLRADTEPERLWR